MRGLIVFLMLLLTGGMAQAAGGQSPLLQEAVDNGTLPPLEERLPANPVVWKDNQWNQEVGNYGGTLRTATFRIMSIISTVGLAQLDRSRTSYLPDLAEGWEWGPDHRSITFFLREGLKWSDGEPFTADDIVFWWEDIITSEYLPQPISTQGFDSARDNVVAVDDYTLRFEFAEPNALFLYDTGGFVDGDVFRFVPRHFWEKYHPKYNPIDGVDPQQQMLDLVDMVNELPRRLDETLDFPVIWPWVPVEYVEEQHLLMKRNPYFWTVDAEGKQLPYLDYVQSYLMKDGDVDAIRLRLIAGEVDFEPRVGTIADISLYNQYAEEAGIKMTYTLFANGSTQGIYFSQGHPDEAKREILQNADFRRAMSLAINRETIRELASLGLGTIGHGFSMTGVYDPEIDGSYAEFDPDRANELLDSIGMDQRDSEGYRLLPNGERFTFTLSFSPTWLPGVVEVAEVSTEGWRNVGIRANAQPTTIQVLLQQAGTGNFDANVQPNTGGLPLEAMNYGYGPRWGYGVPQSEWWRSRNWSADTPRPENAIEPFGALRRAVELDEQLRQTEYLSPEFNEAYHSFLELMADQVFLIGTHQDTPAVWISNRYLHNLPGSDQPSEADFPLSTSGENFPTRAFFYEQEYLNRVN